MLSVLCVTLEALCDLMQPRLMARLIDDGAVHGDMTIVLHTGLWMMGIVALGAVFAVTRNIVSSVVSQNFGTELRDDLFVRIQAMEPDEIDAFDSGSLITRLTNDVSVIQNFVNGMMRIFFKAPVMCVGAIVMAITMDWRSLPIILPVVSLVFILIAVTMKVAYPRFARVQGALDRLNTTMREYLSGIRLVKAFRRFAGEEQRFSHANDELMQSTVHASEITAILSPFLALIVHAGLAAILYVGARAVGAGDLRVGQVMAFVSYMTQILTGLNMISMILNQFVRVKASHIRLLEVLGKERGGESGSCVKSQETADSSGTDHELSTDESSISVDCSVDSALFRQEIRVKNLSFRYRNSTGEAALSCLSFSVGFGESLGIIGSTGSGKSTIAALLMRFYEPSEGEIWVGSMPLRAVSRTQWRNHITMVPQTPMLFSGTIRENILWGKESATEEEIREAARASMAEEFIDTSPKGFDTLIGQSGVNLSGGQKQRLSIARALVRKPDFLVLDDCTGALDVITESRVREALRQRDLTCVWITQRISSAMFCDRILVLDEGRSVGFGSHADLMDSCSVYRDIYLSQIGKEEVD